MSVERRPPEAELEVLRRLRDTADQLGNGSLSPLLTHLVREIALAVMTLLPLTAAALEPPTPAQLEQYRRDGSLASRIAAAKRIGNHRPSPALVQRLAPSLGPSLTAKDAGAHKGLASVGAQRVLALLISFSDCPAYNDALQIDSQLFGEGLSSDYPYESLSRYYQRSSYGLLTITGDTLGWYTTSYPRDAVVQTDAGREALIQEAITHYDAEGHDFSQYDNDSDGTIDYFLVIWTGRNDGGWGTIWWSYQPGYRNGTFRVDGKRLGAYSWQWEAEDYPGVFSPLTVIHETGHALGLPDYYDYEYSVGPGGGVGGLDMMDGVRGDHNCFSKWLLGWLEPQKYNQGSHAITLPAADGAPEAVLLMHGEQPADPFAEYFMVQYRRRQGNDGGPVEVAIPNDGLLIWHVDARLSDEGNFRYNNSYTDHKLLQLMEADGLREIQAGRRADAGDFYLAGSVFGPDSSPSSSRHDLTPTNILVDSIAFGSDGATMSFSASLGSGCAIFCEATVPATAWPGLPVLFRGSAELSNCQGMAGIEWLFGDNTTSGEVVVEHTYHTAQRFLWSLNTTFGDASCARWGATLACCTDTRCWQWQATAAMRGQRAFHAATRLGDGRVLLTGSGLAAFFDPATDSWTPTRRQDPNGGPGAYRAFHVAVALPDGRVLVVGGNGSRLADIFDPATETWTAGGRLNAFRMPPTAALLESGQVLVCGGASPYVAVLGSAELYDPAANSWSVVNSMAEVRIAHTATPLGDGSLLVTGGTADPYGTLLFAAGADDPHSALASATAERYALPNLAGPPVRRPHDWLAP